MNQPRPTLLIASNNTGKLVEFRALLPDSIDLLTLADLGLDSPEETGTTFAENARLKAESAATQAKLISIADDSGLEVDALGGAPGVYSARYAGAAANDEANRAKLLRVMTDVPTAQRSARFQCSVAIATPSGNTVLSAGTCEGSIGWQPIGSNGFGYDSLFVLPDGRTMAELSSDEKNQISHRANAYRAALPSLLRTLGLIEEAET
jgi:XTP/dITP diphosphohydrolase